MRNLVFVSRFEPTDEQIEVAAAQGVNLIHVDEIDPFADDAGDLLLRSINQHRSRGAVVAHAVLALLAFEMGSDVGVFEYVPCPDTGTFRHKSLRVFSHPE